MSTETGLIQIQIHLGREDLLSLSFLERREDLVLMGDVGTGKTHMASALCQLACDSAWRPASSPRRRW